MDLFPGGIIHLVVSATITGSTPLLLDYMIPPGIITHQQLYRPSDRNTDYWVDDITGNNNPSAAV
jgi:hypothetical protein